MGVHPIDSYYPTINGGEHVPAYTPRLGGGDGISFQVSAVIVAIRVGSFQALLDGVFATLPA